MKINIKRLNPDARLPIYSTDGSAGCDLSACISAPVTIEAGQIAKLSTGLAIELPAGYAAFIYGRSGLGTKFGVTLANCVGVIDSDYRGEICVTLINRGTSAYTVNPSDRVAQMVIAPVLRAEFEEQSELSDTVRGIGGFGSTGK